MLYLVFVAASFCCLSEWVLFKYLEFARTLWIAFCIECNSRSNYFNFQCNQKLFNWGLDILNWRCIVSYDSICLWILLSLYLYYLISTKMSVQPLPILVTRNLNLQPFSFIVLGYYVVVINNQVSTLYSLIFILTALILWSCITCRHWTERVGSNPSKKAANLVGSRNWPTKCQTEPYALSTRRFGSFARPGMPSWSSRVSLWPCVWIPR